MKKLIFSVLILLIPVCILESAEAGTSDESLISVFLDGEQLCSDVNPIMQNGRVMVSFRNIFESLGYTVSWDAKKQSVYAYTENNSIYLLMGSNKIYYGTEIYESDTPPILHNGNAMVPLRAVSELSGYDVLWKDDTSTALLYHRQPEDFVPFRFGYSNLASDGKNLYTENRITWKTIMISLKDFTVTEIFQGVANDYIPYKGKLYGHHGYEGEHKFYAVFDLASGKMNYDLGEKVEYSYIYNDKIYYCGRIGSSPTNTLCSMNLDGSAKTNLFDGRREFSYGYFAVDNNRVFGYGRNYAYILPLDTSEPFDILEHCRIESNSVFLSHMALCGDHVYIPLSIYRGEAYPLLPFGILEYNYKTTAHRIIPMDVNINRLQVTDNSIYYTEDLNTYRHNLYRCGLNGENSVMLTKDITNNWTISGNHIYGSIYHSNGNPYSVSRIGTDGRNLKSLITLINQ